MNDYQFRMADDGERVVLRVPDHDQEGVTHWTAHHISVSTARQLMSELKAQTMTDTEINRAIAAAVKLHDFIRSNAGETADWPLQITSSERGALAKLDQLLREFQKAITVTQNTSITSDNVTT